MTFQKWLQQLRCPHRQLTNEVTVSGHGYTEYQVWFCCGCEKGFVRQTREQQ